MYALDKIKQDFKDYKKEFVIINTDVDELPNPSIVMEFQPNKRYYKVVTCNAMYLDMVRFSYNCHIVNGDL
jgi:hypothetical protein